MSNDDLNPLQTIFLPKPGASPEQKQYEQFVGRCWANALAMKERMVANGTWKKYQKDLKRKREAKRPACP